MKTRVYAEAGVGEYWIADVGEGVVTCYREPRSGEYLVIETHQRGESIAPAALPGVQIGVTDLVGDDRA